MSEVLKEINKQEEGKTDFESLKFLYVLPTFELKEQKEEEEQPIASIKTKKQLSSLFYSNKIQYMHAPKISYSFSSINEWLKEEEEEEERRKEFKYVLLMEHYVIARFIVFNKLHLFDENFTGRGLNKQGKRILSFFLCFIYFSFFLSL